MIVHEGQLLRQVNTIYAEHYDLLMSSGLYEELVTKRFLIPHREVEDSPLMQLGVHRILAPEVLPFIAYPYEWSFSQLKDAARVTLSVQKLALKAGMTLKDSSAYNIQFVDSRPLLIDTLSFEKYEEGKPWVAYRQFCQHFLAPLALMSHRDVRLGLMLRDFIDGIPLDLASGLLPMQTRLNFGLLTHIHLHASTQKRYENKPAAERRQAAQTGRVSKQALLGLIENLQATIRKLDWKPDQTAWANYTRGDSYSDAGTDHKKTLVLEFLAETGAKRAVDLGGNTGMYSRIASQQGIYTLSTDFDQGAVEINYRNAVKEKAQNLLPLVIDLTNPSPAIGWNNAERDSFVDRCKVDCVMALALIHHLAISNNVPLLNVAQFMAQLGEWLIIEFVPKSDPKVETLLASREDIFPDYMREGFERAFGEVYTMVRSERITESERVLYLMRRK